MITNAVPIGHKCCAYWSHSYAIWSPCC